MVACLKRKETVTGGDLQQSINMWLGKPEKPAKVTQLREEEPAVPVEPVPVLSLGQQMKAKETGPVKYTCVYPDSCLMREKEPELSPALCGDCKSLRPAPTTCTQSNGENCNIHGVDCKGDILTCNRYTTEPNPTRLKSPFQTAAEVLAHDRDPLGVNKMFTKPEPAQETPQDPLKNLKENRVFYAEKLLECYPDRTKLAVKDLMRDHPSWKTVADVFYFGIDCLTERKR